MKLMFITGNKDIAQYAESCGINRIFVDMEYLGKEERQGHLDAHKAHHTVSDVIDIKKVLKSAELLVRVNPLHIGSYEEINNVIAAGADIVMLPMFTSAREVRDFIDIISGRAKVCLLLETSKAMVRLENILDLSDKIDEIHIGLNDLHLSMGLDFMFEPLSGGIVDLIVDKIKKTNIKYGIGGIACIGGGLIPAELILSEHVRLGSEMVILSRTFHSNAKSLIDLINKIDLKKEIDLINYTYRKLLATDESILLSNQLAFKKSVVDIVDSINSRQ